MAKEDLKITSKNVDEVAEALRKYFVGRLATVRKQQHLARHLSRAALYCDGIVLEFKKFNNKNKK